MTTNYDNAERRLVALIQARLDRGDSTRAIASRAHAAGKELSHSQVNNLHNGLVKKAPDREMIQALAAGLLASEAEVQRAVFLDWYGYDPLLGMGSDWLDQYPQDVRTFVKMLAAWLSTLTEERRGEIQDEFVRRITNG